jgi:hypothetical protein
MVQIYFLGFDVVLLEFNIIIACRYVISINVIKKLQVVMIDDGQI